MLTILSSFDDLSMAAYEPADAASYEADATAGDHCGSMRILRDAGLQPTRQRLLLAQLLFGSDDRHVTAESLHAEAGEAGATISLATIYNTLNQFTEVGLLRRIGIGGSVAFFDTNTTPHPHFFFVDEGQLCDMPASGVDIERMPQPLPGYAIARVDVVVRLRRKQAET
jgi:Fur family iron response transcriptional regulator